MVSSIIQYDHLQIIIDDLFQHSTNHFYFYDLHYILQLNISCQNPKKPHIDPVSMHLLNQLTYSIRFHQLKINIICQFMYHCILQIVACFYHLHTVFFHVLIETLKVL